MKTEGVTLKIGDDAIEQLAEILAKSIKSIPELNTDRLLLMGGWESASRCAGVTLQFIGEMLGITEQFYGVDELILKDDGSFEILEKIITDGTISSRLTEEFSFEKVIEANDFISLLYYMGLLSIRGEIAGFLKFRISNYVIKQLFYDYFRNEIRKRHNLEIRTEDLNEAIIDLVAYNKFETLVIEFEKILKQLSNRDFIGFDEKHLKIFLISLLNYGNSYLIKSEPEMSGKYPDILLLERPPYEMKYQFLIELKKGKNIDEKLNEGKEQVKKYLELEDIKELKNLKSYVIASDGKNVRFKEVR